MSILPILQFPDPRLRTEAKTVLCIDEQVHFLAQNMLATMYDANGIGLAATQVNTHERVVVIDVSETRDQPMVIINPEIVWASDNISKGTEGCLSLPGIYCDIERSEVVKIKYMDKYGKTQEIHADGLLAICIQHEMDHLTGKLIIDYLSPLKKERFQRKLSKQRNRRNKRK